MTYENFAGTPIRPAREILDPSPHIADGGHSTGARSALFVLLTASTGCAMTVLDTNVVAVALPTLARDYQASFTEIEWVVSAYVLFFASLLLPAGAVADRYGRRKIFLLGVTSFGVTSMICGLSPTPATLCAARAFQGASASFMLAPALSIIGHGFHAERDRNHAWAIWGGMMGLTMVLAPLVGGAIASLLDWRWAFHINAPLCAALVVATWLFIDESRDAATRTLDPAGIALFASFMFGLTWALINGPGHGWLSRDTSLAAGLGGFALVGFVAVELRQRRPMLDLALFRNPRFVGAVWAMFAYAACAQVMASMLPLFLQNGLGYNALLAGVAMAPFAVAMLGFPYIGRRLHSHLSSVGILTLGLLIVSLGNVVICGGAFFGNHLFVALGMFVLGGGGGLINGETQKAIIGAVPRDRSGMASGISTTSRFSGILLGFAMLSGVLATSVRGELGGDRCQSACDTLRTWADAIIAGGLPGKLNGIEGEARTLAVMEAQRIYAHGFAASLFIASMVAAISAVAVRTLMTGNSSKADPAG